MIGNTLRHFRLKRGFTQRRLAEMIFLDTKSISSYENNINVPPLPVLADICCILELKFTIEKKRLSFCDIKEDTILIQRQKDTVIEGIHFDSNGKILNNSDLNIAFEKLKNVYFKDLPECFNFTIPLKNTSESIEEVVFDKWTTKDGTLITTIIKQRVPLVSKVFQDQVLKKITGINIADCDSGLIDFCIEDNDLIVFYEYIHYYDANLIINDVCKTIFPISATVYEDIKTLLTNIETHNDSCLKKLINVIQNHKKWDIDLLKFFYNINPNILFAFYDKENNIKTATIDKILKSTDLEKFDCFVPIGGSANFLKCFLENENNLNIKRLKGISKDLDKINEELDSISLLDLIEEFKSENKIIDETLIDIILKKYIDLIKTKKIYSLQNTVLELKEYNLFSSDDIATFCKEYELITDKELFTLAKLLRKNFDHIIIK